MAKDTAHQIKLHPEEVLLKTEPLWIFYNYSLTIIVISSDCESIKADKFQFILLICINVGCCIFSLLFDRQNK